MKRIITIFLILLILVLITVFLVKHIENKEHFQDMSDPMITEPMMSEPMMSDPMMSDPVPTISGSGTIETSRATDIVEELPISGGTLNLHNIENILDKFYEVPAKDNTNCQNTNTCETELECGTNQECVDLHNNGDNKCYDVNNVRSFELESENRSFISFTQQLSSAPLTIKFSFVLKNANNLKYIMSCRSNSWAIFNENNDLFLEIIGNNNSGNDKMKINNLPLECYKYYTINLEVTDKAISTSFNNYLVNASFKPPSCTINSDCSNGKCGGELNNRMCVLDHDTFFIGKYQNQYADIYIGNIEFDRKEVPAIGPGCEFYGGNYKNKRLCLEKCKDQANCGDVDCDRECSEVSICEFETIGRHSIDCIQECIKNNDCTPNFCIQKCENCSPNCPWNKKDESEIDFDSQYFDSRGRPSPLKLTLNTISTDGTKASFRWRTPFQGRAPLKGFLSYLYKTFNKSEGVKINKINISNCAGKTCEYILKDLTPNETYTLGIKSFNNIGLSRTSNLITFKANTTNISMDFSLDQEVDDNDIGEYNYCNIEN